MSCEVVVLRVCKGKCINYSYIIYDAERAGVLVDPAWEPAKIAEVVSSLKLNVKAVLVTHEHSDHIDLAEYMALHYDIPIYMSIDAASNTSIDKRHLALLHDESYVYIDTLQIKPLMTPGHTKSSISYLIDKNLFSGDTLFIEGCGMCIDRSSSPYDLFCTMRRFIDVIPLSTKIYPGHKYHANPGQTFDYVLKNNVYLNFTSEEQFVRFRMRDGQTGLMNFL
jgi:hydroxyacylglutathione hydrolase